MQKFMIAYYGGSQPKTKEEGMAHMQKWQEWIEGLGDAVINPGTPLPSSKMITAEGVEEDKNLESMKGFAIIQAENFDLAVKMAKSDPFLETGGTIRLSQMMEMPH